MDKIDTIVDKLLSLSGDYRSDVEKIVGYKWYGWKEECRTDLIGVIQKIIKRTKDA